MIRFFMLSWVLYWLMFFVLPAESIYEGVFKAFLLQLLFVFLVVFGFFSFKLVLPVSKAPEPYDVYSKNNIKMLKICLSVSIIGTVFLIFDKVYIQGIDYSKGLAAAREAWRREGLERGGSVSSAYSVIGYLFNSGYFIAAIIFITSGSQLTALNRFLTLVLIFILLMLNSVIAGGRSNVLLMAILVSCTVASIRGFSIRELLGRRLVILLYLAVFLSGFYMLYVFASRANASGMTPVEYAESFGPYLGLRVYDWVFEFNDPSIMMDLLALIILCIGYLTHSLATTAALVTHGTGNEIVVFVHLANIFHKMNLMDAPNVNWLLAGRFPSLPGALYYQFGFYGFVVLSLALGWLSSIGQHLYRLKPKSLIFMFINISMFSILITSPLLLVLDFMSYPFIILFLIITVFLKSFFMSLKRC